MGGKQAKKLRKQDKEMQELLKAPLGVMISAMVDFKGMVEGLLAQKQEQYLVDFSKEFNAAFELFNQYVGVLEFDANSEYGKSSEPLYAIMDSIPSNLRKTLLVGLERYLNIISESAKEATNGVAMGELIETSDVCGKLYNQLYDMYCQPILGEETYRFFANHVAEQAIETAHFAIEEETRIFNENHGDPEPLEWANQYLKESENLKKVSAEVKAKPDTFDFITELFEKLDETGKAFFMNEHLMGVIQTYEADLEDGELSDENRKFLYLARQIYTELDNLVRQ